MTKILEKLKEARELHGRVIEGDDAASLSLSVALDALIKEVEAMTRPGAIICWVEGIQGSGTCDLTTGYCGFWSGKDAHDYVNKLHAEKNMTYVKAFPIHVKEVK